MGSIASQITNLTIVYSIFYSDADQRKHQSSASLAFVRGIHRAPVNSSHKWPVTRNMFPFDDVIMFWCWLSLCVPFTNSLIAYNSFMLVATFIGIFHFMTFPFSWRHHDQLPFIWQLRNKLRRGNTASSNCEQISGGHAFFDRWQLWLCSNAKLYI